MVLNVDGLVGIIVQRGFVNSSKEQMQIVLSVLHIQQAVNMTGRVVLQ